MPNYSEQDLKYAAEFREEIHREALAIVRKTRPDVAEVIDRHPVEDYFQEHWDYPGKWYTIVAVPYGYNSRKALVDTIVRDTLSKGVPARESAAHTQGPRVSNLRELVNDPFYELIKKYDGCVIDYCLIEDDTPHRGRRSHSAAVLFAMLKVIERDIRYCRETEDEPFPWELDFGKAQAHPIDPATLFRVPQIVRTDYVGQRVYDCGRPAPLKGEQIPYWYAFWETPHRSGYGPDDFRKVNAALFPAGTEELEAYEWTTDWSNYFDDGHEWWGAACWSVYDRHMNRYVVIMASTTD